MTQIAIGMVSFGVLCLNATAAADISITRSGVGQAFVVENSIVNGERQITILGEGEASVGVRITAISGSNPIRYIHIASRRFGNLNQGT